MYDSRPRGRDGEPIEEVLPSAINATATSERASRAGGELARREFSEEPPMAVMRADSVANRLNELPAPLVVAGAILLVALVVAAIVLI